MMNISISGGGFALLGVVLLGLTGPFAALYLTIRLNRHPR
jgi:hypothetical protein